MARSATTGRYVARRRVVGSGRRLRIVGGLPGLAGSEVGGVRSGEPLVLGGATAQETTETSEKVTTKSQK